MKSETPAQIFNSVQRGIEETASYKCIYTFNHKDSEKGIIDAFGQLQFLNNVFLAPRESITYRHNEDSHVIIIPISGALNYSNNINKGELISSEQIKIAEIEKKLPYTLNNPYEEEWSNYLHIGFKTNLSHTKHQPAIQNIEFKNMDELVCFDLGTQDKSAGYIGIYQGRSEDNYTLKNSSHGIFVYVIKGAFEVQGRLLEFSDGLSLSDTKEIEFEALSNNAIIMILEIKLN